MPTIGPDLPSHVLASWLPICSHPHWIELHGGLLSRCTRCLLVVTAVRPGLPYDEQYFTEEQQGGYDFDSDFAQRHDRSRFLPELRRLERQVKHGRILDIGCATGSFLALARERGWEVSGVEASDFARAHAEKRLGLPLYRGLSEMPEGARFDVVTLHHVLEHIEKPLPFLHDEVLPRVKGRLHIEVPNFASLASRVHGRRWGDLRPDQHVYHYTADTLRALVGQAGFRTLRCYTLWESLWSLRSALTIAQLLLRAAVPGDRETTAPSDPIVETASYRAPTAARRAATEVSRILMAPVRRMLESAGLGERLVVEAEPAPSHSASHSGEDRGEAGARS
jgi:SAM-dependent methyltransferase